MNKFTFLVAFLLCVLLMSAQKKATKHPFTLGPKINIESNSLPISKSIQGILKYDNGVGLFGLGNPAYHTMALYHRFPAELINTYIGASLTHFEVGFWDPSGYTKTILRIKEDSINSNPIYEQEVDVDLLHMGFNLFELTDAYVIPENKDIFIGVFIESNGSMGLCVDTDFTSVYENSTLLYFNDSYFGSISSEYGDALIRGIISDDGNIEGEVSDLAIKSLNLKSQDCMLSNNETIVVCLKNEGKSHITDTVHLDISVDDKTIESSHFFKEFASEDSIFIEVNGFDMSTLKKYNISAEHLFKDHVLYNNKSEKTIITGDSKITIDLTTDEFAYETSWEVYDNEGTVIASNGVLNPVSQCITDICVAKSGCYSVKIFDVYGDGLSFGQGTFTIAYNDSIIATCPEGGNFGEEFSVFGIGDGCMNNDLRLIEISTAEQIEPGLIDISGKIMNFGTDNVNSFDVSYKIGDHISDTFTIANVNIESGSEYAFTHNVPYEFNTEGIYLIELTISNPNGVDDENPNDNNLSKEIEVVLGLYPKKQLFEHFTSSTCGPCASYTPLADALLLNNQDNYTLIRYQVSWPGQGDPYATQQTQKRVGYYTVSGVPSVYRNGNYDMDVSQPGFDSYADEFSIFNINVEATIQDSIVSVNTVINSLANANAGLKVHISIIENETTENVGTNGEKEWLNVMMAMLPSSDGTQLEDIEKNVPVTISETYDMSSTFVEELSDLSVVVFIQDDSNKEVLQSTMIPIDVVGIEEKSVNNFNVYPNPFNESIVVNNLTNAKQIIITNILGQPIINITEFESSLKLSTKEFNKGIYFVSIIDIANNINTLKIVKQ